MLEKIQQKETRADQSPGFFFRAFGAYAASKSSFALRRTSTTSTSYCFNSIHLKLSFINVCFSIPF